jgi:hypothetical protein
LICSAIVAFLGFLLATASADPIRGYHIGNSLTWGAVSPGFSDAFQSIGASIQMGYHIRCGSPLENIVADPSVRCVPAPAPFADWHTAMTQYTWDYVTLQTHAGTAAGEIQAAIDVVTTTTAAGRNSDTRFFVYSAWPTLSNSLTYRQVRTQSLTSLALNTNAFLGTLHSQLAASFPTIDIGYIPAGEVLLQLDDMLRATPVAGLNNAWDLYGDLYHLNDSGRYVAHATMASVLTGTRPHELAFPALFNGIDPAFKALANEAIENVISNDARVMPLPEPEMPSVLVLVAGATCWYLTSKRVYFARQSMS